jgi:hypothetical protein
MQNKNHWLTRWGLMLQRYNLILKHIFYNIFARWCTVINNNYSNEQSNISSVLYIHNISSLEEKVWIQTFCNKFRFQLNHNIITVTFINSMQNKNHWLTRWGLMLQRYNLIIKHIKCNDNFIANVLSRIRYYCDELKSKFIDGLFPFFIIWTCLLGFPCQDTVKVRSSIHWTKSDF